MSTWKEFFHHKRTQAKCHRPCLFCKDWTICKFNADLGGKQQEFFNKGYDEGYKDGFKKCLQTFNLERLYTIKERGYKRNGSNDI